MTLRSFLPLSWKGRSVAYESSIDGPAQQSRLSAHFSPNIFLHGWLSLRLHKDIYQKYKYKYTSMFLPKLKKLFILVTHLRWWDVLVTWNWDNNRKHCLQTFLCCFVFFPSSWLSSHCDHYRGTTSTIHVFSQSPATLPRNANRCKLEINFILNVFVVLKVIITIVFFIFVVKKEWEWLQSMKKWEWLQVMKKWEWWNLLPLFSPSWNLHIQGNLSFATPWWSGSRKRMVL